MKILNNRTRRVGEKLEQSCLILYYKKNSIDGLVSELITIYRDMQKFS